MNEVSDLYNWIYSCTKSCLTNKNRNVNFNCSKLKKKTFIIITAEWGWYRAEWGGNGTFYFIVIRLKKIINKIIKLIRLDIISFLYKVGNKIICWNLEFGF